MENLIESLHSAVAFLFAARIFILFVLVIVIARWAFSWFQPTDPKKYHEWRKKSMFRPRNFMDHSR